jgi:hypothetical protein
MTEDQLTSALAAIPISTLPAPLLQQLQQPLAQSAQTRAAVIAKSVTTASSGSIVKIIAASVAAIALIGGVTWQIKHHPAQHAASAPAASTHLVYTEPPPPADQATTINDNEWETTSFASGLNTENADSEIIANHIRFTVSDATLRHVWIHRLADELDASRYPILVVTYRATNTDTADKGNYVIWLDDGHYREPGHVIKPMVCKDVIADGQVHEFRKNLLRIDAKPEGPLQMIALGVRAGDKVPATFELIDLRFESIKK